MEIKWFAELCHQLCRDHKEKEEGQISLSVVLFLNAILDWNLKSFYKIWSDTKTLILNGIFLGGGGGKWIIFSIFHSFWGQVLPVKFVFCLKNNFCVLIVRRLAFCIAIFCFQMLNFLSYCYFSSLVFVLDRVPEWVVILHEGAFQFASFRNVSTYCGVKVSCSM